jgi:hypothetical protein
MLRSGSNKREKEGVIKKIISLYIIRITASINITLPALFLACEAFSFMQEHSLNMLHLTSRNLNKRTEEIVQLKNSVICTLHEI